MLSFKGVRKKYGATVALDGLDLEVRKGEIFGLLGPNGAGKSTTIHLAIGLIAPDAGTIRLGENGSPADPAARARLGVAPQRLAIYERLSGAENLAFFAATFGLRGAELRRKVDAALDFVGLADRKNDPAMNYSGGMQRRLNIAAAIVHDPDLILLDEPTVGVDPQSRNLIFDKILELKKRGKTVIYTTHYMEEAERLCDRVGVIDHGRLLDLDTVDGLLARHGAAPVLVVEKDGASARYETPEPLAMLNKLAGEDGGFTSFHLERASLEGVFLRLTGRSLRD